MKTKQTKRKVKKRTYYLRSLKHRINNTLRNKITKAINELRIYGTRQNVRNNLVKLTATTLDRKRIKFQACNKINRGSGSFADDLQKDNRLNQRYDTRFQTRLLIADIINSPPNKNSANQYVEMSVNTSVSEKPEGNQKIQTPRYVTRRQLTKLKDKLPFLIRKIKNVFNTDQLLKLQRRKSRLSFLRRRYRTRQWLRLFENKKLNKQNEKLKCDLQRCSESCIFQAVTYSRETVTPKELQTKSGVKSSKKLEVSYQDTSFISSNQVMSLNQKLNIVAYVPESNSVQRDFEDIMSPGSENQIDNAGSYITIPTDSRILKIKDKMSFSDQIKDTIGPEKKSKVISRDPNTVSIENTLGYDAEICNISTDKIKTNLHKEPKRDNYNELVHKRSENEPSLMCLEEGIGEDFSISCSNTSNFEGDIEKLISSDIITIKSSNREHSVVRQYSINTGVQDNKCNAFPSSKEFELVNMTPIFPRDSADQSSVKETKSNTPLKGSSHPDSENFSSNNTDTFLSSSVNNECSSSMLNNLEIDNRDVDSENRRLSVNGSSLQQRCDADNDKSMAETNNKKTKIQTRTSKLFSPDSNADSVQTETSETDKRFEIVNAVKPTENKLPTYANLTTESIQYENVQTNNTDAEIPKCETGGIYGKSEKLRNVDMSVFTKSEGSSYYLEHDDLNAFSDFKYGNTRDPIANAENDYYSAMVTVNNDNSFPLERSSTIILSSANASLESFLNEVNRLERSPSSLSI